MSILVDKTLILIGSLLLATFGDLIQDLDMATPNKNKFSMQFGRRL